MPLNVIIFLFFINHKVIMVLFDDLLLFFLEKCWFGDYVVDDIYLFIERSVAPSFPIWTMLIVTKTTPFNLLYKPWIISFIRDNLRFHTILIKVSNEMLFMGTWGAYLLILNNWLCIKWDVKCLHPPPPPIMLPLSWSLNLENADPNILKMHSHIRISFWW